MAQEVAQLSRAVHPVLVPRPDQPVAPLAVHKVMQPVPRDVQRPAERVAVEVGDDAVRSHELVAVRRQRVGLVQSGGLVDDVGGQQVEDVTRHGAP
jgi:hypothetical protein